MLDLLTMAITGIKTPRLPALLDACKHHTADKQVNHNIKQKPIHFFTAALKRREYVPHLHAANWLLSFS